MAATPAYAINRGYTIDAAYNQQAFLYQASVKAAALAAGYDSKFRDQQAEINRRNTKISELRTALRQNGANATALKGQIDLLQTENTKLMAQFTAALAAKDQDYARLLDSLTRVGDRLTETQEGREALSAYVAGDPGSYVKTKIVLRKIIEAEKGLRQRKAAAQAKQDAIARASQLRDFAAFTLDGRDRGTETTEEVIAAYQQVVAVDPSNHWDWVELARLYQDSGQQNLALGAAHTGLAPV